MATESSPQPSAPSAGGGFIFPEHTEADFQEQVALSEAFPGAIMISLPTTPETKKRFEEPLGGTKKRFEEPLGGTKKRFEDDEKVLKETVEMMKSRGLSIDALTAFMKKESEELEAKRLKEVEAIKLKQVELEKEQFLAAIKAKNLKVLAKMKTINPSICNFPDYFLEVVETGDIPFISTFSLDQWGRDIISLSDSYMIQFISNLLKSGTFIPAMKYRVLMSQILQKIGYFKSILKMTVTSPYYPAAFESIVNWCLGYSGHSRDPFEAAVLDLILSETANEDLTVKGYEFYSKGRLFQWFRNPEILFDKKTYLQTAIDWGNPFGIEQVLKDQTSPVRWERDYTLALNRLVKKNVSTTIKKVIEVLCKYSQAVSLTSSVLLTIVYCGIENEVLVREIETIVHSSKEIERIKMKEEFRALLSMM